MNKFDILNRQTRDYNNRNVDRFNPSTQKNYSNGNWKPNYCNQQTYYQNNGQYSKKYY